MKDQGKMSELNLSSHCYQPSNAVGRMSESYENCAFITPNNSIRDCEMLFETGHDNDKEKSRIIKTVHQPLETRPVKLLKFSKPTIKWQATGTMHQKLMTANTCYQRYMTKYNSSRQVQRRCTPLTNKAFWSIYRGERPQDFLITEKKLKVLDLTYFMSDEDDITVNFTAFPNAAPIEVIKRRAKKEPRADAPSSDREDYFPQSGAVSPVCSVAFQTAASVCAEKLAVAPSLSLALIKSKSEELLHALEQRSELVTLFCLLTSLYIAYRIITNLALLLTWWCGFAVSSMMGKTTPKQQQSLFDALFSPQSTKRRQDRSRKFREMAPQAGFLSSDDGAAFTGTKPKSTVSSPKKIPPKKPQSSTESPPGQEYIPWSGQCNFGGVPKPKRDQSKLNGPLNGFGVGM